MHSLVRVILWIVIVIPFSYGQGELEKLPSTVNTMAYDESSPVLSKDGTRLFFTRTASPDFNHDIMNDDGQLSSNNEDEIYHQRLSTIYSQIAGRTIHDPTHSVYNQDIWYASISDDTIRSTYHPGYPLNSALTNSLVSTGMNPEEYVIINQFYEDGSMYAGFSRVNILNNGEQSFPKPMYIYEFEADSSDVNLTMTPRGHVLVLSMHRSDSRGANDLFVSFYVRENVWSAPINMGDVLNTEFQETTPHITPDKRFIYFSSNRPGGPGGNDIYVSERLDYTWLHWSTPVLLKGEANSSFDDSQPYFDPDNHYMYFTSRRDGSSDIFRIRLTPRPQLKKPIFVRGTIIDVNTGQPTRSELFWGQQSSSKFLEYFNSYDGHFEVTLAEYEPYKFQPRKARNTSQKILVDPRIIEKQGKDTIDMVLFVTPDEIEEMIPSTEEKISTARKLKESTYQSKKSGHQEDSISLADKLFIYKIQFVKASPVILTKSKQAMQDLISLMESHPTMQILIEGHTDNVGDELSLINLSEQRAEVVKEYLVAHGIEHTRVLTSGLGATQPVHENTTESGREKNRRVEIKIIKP
ncbi:MAG TPA: OmpA family protein [Saprospiraceae bacterium]|nr:OmpA family protein [Saprospiraceae bacterium]